MSYKQDLLDCYNRIRPYIHRTPIMSSRSINELVDAEVVFKCENFQRTGSFKMRGASNAILSLSKEQQQKGVVTHSSGNFAQAVALGAKSIGVTANIVMPNTAPKVKQSAVKGYDGIITFSEPTIEARSAAATKIEQEVGASFLHPSNQIQVIIGQGTATMELLEDHPDLDYILTPVGGGGLVAGTALAAYHFGNVCRVIGCEPENADDASRSFKSGNIEKNTTANTIADGLRTELGDVNFPIIKQHVEDIMLIDEEAIKNAMFMVWERMKILIEPSSAVPLAALIKNKERFKNKKIGIVVSGGNVDVSNFTK